MPHTVVVLSGGLDSTVALWASLMSNQVTAVTVDYGQRHIKEIGAAQSVVDYYRRSIGRTVAAGDPTNSLLDHVIIGAPSLGRSLSGSALTDDRVSVPHGHYTAPTMASTIVPNRNMIIASIAAGIAVARGSDTIVLGVHAGDHPVYPDCRPAFIEALQACIRIATDTKLNVVAPFGDMSKQRIVSIGYSIGAPMHLTWSCYQGDNKHCGKCGTCVERHEAFVLAGIDDPTEYE